MIQDYVNKAIKELDKTRARCNSTFIDEEMDEQEKAIRDAAQSFRASLPISYFVNRGAAYQNFLYDALTYTFTKEAFDVLKFQARGLCKWFGNMEAWRKEETEPLIKDDERYMWTQLEHLKCLVMAYDCSVRDIDVVSFCTEGRAIEQLLKEVSE